MTDAVVSQVVTETLRTNTAPNAEVTQLAVEVLRPNGTAGLAGSAGSFTLTGNAATLTYRRILTSAVGSYSLTGNDVSFAYLPSLELLGGAFTLTGNNATLTFQRVLTCSVGAFSYTGNAATLTKITPSSSTGIALLIGL